jgi:hypothetical protein
MKIKYLPKSKEISRKEAEEWARSKLDYTIQDYVVANLKEVN